MTVSDYLYYVILPVLAVAILLIFVRFIKGPSLSDRVVSLDLLLTTGIGVIAVYSVYTDQATFLDIAMIMALIAFLGTVAYSFYLEKREKND
ncbi:MAG TPA: cation:proton antiporter [Cyclobacteriaceae bacterium]|nr:cation:proton antiporter [Cyclobacteriaceae bacterium]